MKIMHTKYNINLIEKCWKCLKQNYSSFIFENAVFCLNLKEKCWQYRKKKKNLDYNILKWILRKFHRIMLK